MIPKNPKAAGAFSPRPLFLYFRVIVISSEVEIYEVTLWGSFYKISPPLNKAKESK